MKNKYDVIKKFKPLVKEKENFYWVTNNLENNIILSLLGFLDKYTFYTGYHYTITNIKTQKVTNKKWNIIFTNQAISTEDLSEYANYMVRLKNIKNSEFTKKREKSLKSLISEHKKYTMISQCKKAIDGEWK